MGKTYKGKDKAKAKAAKAKTKADRKTKRVRTFAFFALALALLSGCLHPDNEQPTKAQTQNNKFKDCTFIVATKCSVSNRVVRADGTKDIPAVELFTQTQSLETGGNDTTTLDNDQTPSFSLPISIDARYNDALSAATPVSRSTLSSIGSGIGAVLDLMVSKGSGSVSVTKKDGSAATVQCKDGQCSFVDDGADE